MEPRHNHAWLLRGHTNHDDALMIIRCIVNRVEKIFIKGEQSRVPAYEFVQDPWITGSTQLTNSGLMAGQPWNFVDRLTDNLRDIVITEEQNLGFRVCIADNWVGGVPPPAAPGLTAYPESDRA